MGEIYDDRFLVKPVKSTAYLVERIIIKALNERVGVILYL